MLSDPDLISFDPPARPLAAWSGLRTFLRNFIETYPRSTYEQEVTRITTGFSDLLLVCDPALIQEVLVERSDVFGRDAMWRRALGPLFGETSLVLAEGANWRWQRRAVAPTFRYETLLSFVPTFAEIAGRQVLRWRHAPKNEPVEVGAGMSQTTFDVIVETMLGGSAALDSEGCRRALIETLRAAQWHSLFALFSLPGWMPFPGRQRAMRANRYLHANMSRVVAVRRANPSSRSDLFELLLVARDVESARSMTDAELVTNLATFVSAGHETTAVALTWTLWLVARNATLQHQLFDEVIAAAGEEPIGAAHLDRLVLCRQAIQEAIRLYPPVASLSRQAKVETTLGEHQVKPSTYVIVPIYALHRHMRLWENPNTFMLDRFAPDQAKARSRYAYLPFGGGPRVCIGASFAMIEATVVLATLVRAFHFRPVPGHKPRPVARASLRPQGGMPIFIESR